MVPELTYMIILIVIIISVSYGVYWYYDKYFRDNETEEEESGKDNQNKVNDDPINEIKEIHNRLQKQVNLNTKMNRKVVSYLEARHTENTDTKVLATDNQSKVMKHDNRLNTLVNRNRDNRRKIQTINANVNQLRASVAYDRQMLIRPFVKELSERYIVNDTQKKMLFDTYLLGLLDPVVLQGFYGVSPDIMLKEHRSEIFAFVDKMFNEFEIMNYYLSAKTWNQAFYQSDLPYAYTYADMHRNDINLSKKLEFVLVSYLPMLVSYIDNHINTIIDTVDDMMMQYFATIPSIDHHFNEFLTNLNIADFIDDEQHLFTMIAKHSMRMLYTEEDLHWMSFKQRIHNYFNTVESKLLFVLIPEYLIMIQYTNNYFNYTQRTPYENFVQKYLLDVDVVDNVENVLNYYTILSQFKCGQPMKNSILLMLLQRDDNAQLFQNTILPKVNNMIHNSEHIGTEITMGSFTCETNNIIQEEDEEESV